MAYKYNVFTSKLDYYIGSDGIAAAAAHGVEWDEDDSSPSLDRIGSLVGTAVGSSPGNAVLPIQASMRRCILNDSGEVQYYLYDGDSTLKEDGSTPANLDGTDGQVMVEIPKFYYKYSYNAATHRHQWWVSDVQLSGYKVHPAFQKNGSEVDNRYMGAYEGVLYDVSNSQYTNGLYLPSASGTFTASTDTIERTVESHPFTLLEVGDKIKVSGTTNNNTTFTVVTPGDQSITVTSGTVTDEVSANAVIEIERDWTATTGDVLGSVSGKAPINQGTRANFRAVSKNRGIAWRQQDYDLVSAIQLLYVVEYASWYSQNVIGAGLTNFGSANWTSRNNLNPIESTGLSNGLGNASGGVDNGADGLGSYMSYRGIENLFGHIWKWVDGFNINNGIPYVSNIDTDFADDTTINYTRLEDTDGSGITLPQVNDYQVTLEQIDRGFLPASVVGGSSSTYITDYYYQGAGWRVAILGGYAYGGGRAGFFFWGLYSSSLLYRYFGGRLSY